MKLLILFLILSQMTLAFAVDEKNEKKVALCNPSKEYVATVNYLKDKKEFSLEEKEIRRVADEISKHCNGAFERFSNVTNLLVVAGMSGKDSLEAGVKFAKEEKKVTMTFLSIFKQCYAEDYLNLDLMTSYKIAVSLSLDIEKFNQNIEKDFSELVKFCRSDELTLPFGECAALASRVIKKGEKFEAPMAESFKKLFRFLVEKDGPNRPSFDAVKISEEALTHGPSATQNFIWAYKHGTSKEGMGLDSSEAINFALKMSARSYKENSKN